MVKDSSRDSAIKKKRKTTSTGDGDEPDIYKKTIEYEEKEALRRPSEVDAKLYFNICKEIRSLLAEIGELKCKSNDKAKIQEKTTEICLRIVLLKKLNRMEKVRQVGPKELLAVEKQKVDSINLQYQNLLYEANHLIFEYRKCFQFKSKDEFIDLVPIEEFLAKAPHNLTEKFVQYDKNDEIIKHELRLARLEWELQQRIQLAEMCKNLEEEKTKLLQDIEERRTRLNKLTPLLKNLMNATKPIQEHLNLNIDKIQIEHKLAKLLPYPLYIFYANLDAYRQVNDHSMNILIVGDQDEAQQWKELQQQKNITGTDEDDDNDDNDDDELEQETQEIEVQVKKRRHRKSVIEINPLEEKKKRLLELHPLSIELTIKATNSVTINLKFFYLTKLEIITVKSTIEIPTIITTNTAHDVLSSESVLLELSENDMGLTSPNPCTTYQLKKVGINSYQNLVPNFGYAYNWAQKICGLDFLSKQGIFNKNSDEISQNNVEIVMKTLKKRLKFRFALAKQLENLEKNILPPLPSNLQLTHNPISTITKWQQITYQDFCQNQFTETLIEADLITTNDLFYLAKITRSNANLNAFIVVKNNYPIIAPIFALLLNFNGQQRHSFNDDNIRDMERAINIDFNPEFNNPNYLLTAQIVSLCLCLDIYLETEDPKQFPQNTLYIKSNCARNRRKPFKFRNIGIGLFTQ